MSEFTVAYIQIDHSCKLDLGTVEGLSCETEESGLMAMNNFGRSMPESVLSVELHRLELVNLECGLMI